MNNRLSKVLALILAVMLVFTVSLFAVSAEESDDASEAESVAESEAESVAESEEESEASAAESKSESAAESATSAAESKSESAAESKAESEAPKEESSSSIPWKLIITIAVAVVIVAVLFILTRTKTKFGQKIAKFFKDYKSETKKITWMPWKELVKATATVLVILAVAAIFVGLLDFAFSSLVQLLSSIG